MRFSGSDSEQDPGGLSPDRSVPGTPKECRKTRLAACSHPRLLPARCSSKPIDAGVSKSCPFVFVNLPVEEETLYVP